MEHRRQHLACQAYLRDVQAMAKGGEAKKKAGKAKKKEAGEA